MLCFFGGYYKFIGNFYNSRNRIAVLFISLSSPLEPREYHFSESVCRACVCVCVNACVFVCVTYRFRNRFNCDSLIYVCIHWICVCAPLYSFASLQAYATRYVHMAVLYTVCVFASSTHTRARHVYRCIRVYVGTAFNVFVSNLKTFAHTTAEPNTHKHTQPYTWSWPRSLTIFFIQLASLYSHFLYYISIQCLELDRFRHINYENAHAALKHRIIVSLSLSMCVSLSLSCVYVNWIGYP